MVDHAHGSFRESASELGKSRMIWRRLIEGKSQNHNYKVVFLWRPPYDYIASS